MRDDISVCEEKNYQKIYQDESEGLRNFMYYKTGSLNRAEDLMHEAFIKLFENCKKVFFEKAKSYLFTVANRLFINEINHQKVVLKFEKNNQLAQQNTESPSFILEEKEFKSRLENALSKLSEVQRETFLMNRIDKLSYQEIAEKLDISVKTVEKRIHNSLLYLKNELEELKNRKI